MAFLDTSVLLYAVSRDPAEREKAARANEILDAGDVELSTQVLQEFYVQATRSTRRDRLDHEQAIGVVETLLAFPVQETTAALVLAAAETRQRFRISYWDAAFLEAARALGSGPRAVRASVRRSRLRRRPRRESVSRRLTGAGEALG